MNLLKKPLTLSAWDIGRFFLNFLVAYLVFFMTLFLSKYFDLPAGQTFSLRQWAIIGVGSAVLVVFTYLRELQVTKKKEGQLKERKVIYDCIGGAIEKLIELGEAQAEDGKDKTPYIAGLLRYIEKVVELALREAGIQIGDITSNLMVVKDNPLALDLLYFGTYLTGRKKIVLPITQPILPGAPEAYLLKKAMYINDIKAPEYKKYFDQGKSYRSIISIPITESNDTVFAVLNIDSDIPDQFVSKDFVDKKVIPTVTPLTLLLRLEKDIILNTGK